MVLAAFSNILLLFRNYTLNYFILTVLVLGERKFKMKALYYL